MPQNRRESIIFTVMMCFVMVLVMSNYNTALVLGAVSRNSISSAWMGLPFAFLFAMACDLLLVSDLAKRFTFRYLIKPEDAAIKKIICVSCAMVLPMVIIMSLYGAIEYNLHVGQWHLFVNTWVRNIGKNLIVALPLQLLIAGPLVRRIFRLIFPVNNV